MHSAYLIMSRIFHSGRVTVSWNIGPDHYAQHYLLIDEQGSVLEDANSYFNCMDNSVNYGEALSFIAARYPGCDVRGLANDSGYDTFYIFHEGRLKRVRFENHFQVQYPTAAEGWKETVWRRTTSIWKPRGTVISALGAQPPVPFSPSVGTRTVAERIIQNGMIIQDKV